MRILDSSQQQRAVEAMRAYLEAPPDEQGQTPRKLQLQRDQKRRELIEEELKPLLDRYLNSDVPLEEFKAKVDGINKRHGYWGFKGIKGQMFFNMVVNTANDPAECDQELKSALTMPTSEDMAKSRIRTFVSYVRRLGDDHLEHGGTKHGRPKLGSVPFFLSYFWQVHDPEAWPAHYTNSANTMSDLNLWQPTDDPAENYITFKRVHEELATLFTEASGEKFDLYEVEHVFWFNGGNPSAAAKPTADNETKPVPKPRQPTVSVGADGKLPDSYVPPIVSILPAMATNTLQLSAAAKESGTSLDRAFEKSINAAFTILGYETRLLGQGQGRVPDGLAIDSDNSYALIWDGKMRSNGYSLGTDDRTIREYINTQSRDLKKRRSLKNIYYAIVSSSFQDDYDDAARMLKMETDISEVCLLEAESLVAMVDAKLREPHQVTLGPDGLQRVFSSSGIVTAEDVGEMLG